MDTHVRENKEKKEIGEDEFNDLFDDGHVVYRLPQIFSKHENHEARENMVKITCVLRENLEFIRNNLWTRVRNLPKMEQTISFKD